MTIQCNNLRAQKFEPLWDVLVVDVMALSICSQHLTQDGLRLSKPEQVLIGAYLLPIGHLDLAV